MEVKTTIELEETWSAGTTKMPRYLSSSAHVFAIRNSLLSPYFFNGKKGSAE
jgi:hypothetical protein